MFCMQKLGQKVVPAVAFSKIRVISGLNDMLKLIMVFNQEDCFDVVLSKVVQDLYLLQ